MGWARVRAGESGHHNGFPRLRRSLPWPRRHRHVARTDRVDECLRPLTQEFIQTVANRIIELDISVKHDDRITYDEYIEARRPQEAPAVPGAF